jgi:indole-3-glycerol phosphate synthase
MNLWPFRRETVLEKIASAARIRIAREKERIPINVLRTMNLEPRIPIDFAAPLREPGLHVIAEVKMASPSEGSIGGNLDPLDVALAYAKNGASAVSVLTEPDFFEGSLDYLARIREDVKLPLLMKDFIVDEYQVMQGWVYGADAVLLIAALLGRNGLHRMMQAASALGLSALVEVHDEWEMGLALKEGAKIIGVNNRDLKTLKIDMNVSRKLAAMGRRENVVLICESGLKDRRTMEEMAALGYRGFLVGTYLIKSGKPGEALAALLGKEAAA